MATTGGIQELMAAETRASQIVAEARIGRSGRMKQANADAGDLVDTYKSEKQQEFNNKVLAAGGSGGSQSAKLQAKTNRETTAMKAMFDKNQQKAIDVLLSKCCEVNLSVPTARVRATQKIYAE
mmetsp:Transcript_13395/g.15792  ORF Transcript_13395/g.15792 Transcript_13395/m.15792 type:complete len:124 (-) Transcript_13395:130-501(-)|eukprot:CAMPEP_0198250300 /NCGR_PEP_ID=MMETSP1447-20131203/1544_1 /TAXON_ID=420782 /ORGANISM="Chaetoceros dichaeta, Strain CCMP1751" /LENGTH=123 /DNA_ID=CAMNT_0043935111 /DNA_START=64 /DNA_END=435 /DNA_ORIENTATION=+